MKQKLTSPYGSWKSPITSELIVSRTIGLGDIALRGDDSYWIEGRPWEAGRCVIVRRTPDGQMRDVTPPPYNVRTRVHEYGGGAMLVADDAIFFSNFSDNRVYCLREGNTVQPLTAEGKMRYADFCLDASRNRLICVREDHTTSDTQCDNALVAVDLSTGINEVLAGGDDFYSSPRLSPDGRQLAWLSWNHPLMPWDGTQLWRAEFTSSGTLGQASRIAGGSNESVFQPEWSPDNRLHFVSDPTGWWNHYRWLNGRVEALCPMEREFGAPQWVCGMSLYEFVSAREILCAYNELGRWRLGSLDISRKSLQPIELPYAEIRQLRVAGKRAVFCAGSPSQPDAIVQLDLATKSWEVLQRSSSVAVDEGYLSVAEPIEFPTEYTLTAHAFHYPPKNRDYVAPAGERPPLIVISHGGPTSATPSTLRLPIQYWTSRGFAVVDVNYGGSTGYGRAYRERLNGNWGVVDVDDCIHAARYLIDRGAADGARVIIRGGSAGGYTTLAALTFRDFFQAGSSYYGISDLEALEHDCHKFESQYNSTLIAPSAQAKALYFERSPIHHADRLSAPVILLQGLDDKVVPPNQSERLVEALRAKSIPVAYIAFEGEGHGFRKAENIRRALEAELYFFGRVFGFPTEAEPDPSVDW